MYPNYFFVSGCFPKNDMEEMVATYRKTRKKKRKSPLAVAWVIIRRVLIFLLVTVLLLVGIAYLTLFKIKNSSEAARNLLITTLMESGQLKFVAKMVCSNKEIEEIVSTNAMKKMEVEQNTSLITVETEDNSEVVTESSEVFDANGIRLEEITGRSFYAKMLIVKDPSQVIVGSTHNGTSWPEYGKELMDLANDAGGVAAINGGLYVSTGNKGGQPLGVVVQNGKITYNNPSGLAGLYIIGMNNDNILIVEEITGKSANEVAAYVEEKGIRDAVAFQDEASDANNHFVPLIINGEPRELGGQGSGANPRTVIGQRADGAMLLLVTDGRGTSGHLGATASDLIAIMQDYNAINAANLDGGSSSTMVYNGNWEMTSVTFYYQNSSWKLPTAFVVKPKGGN